MAIAMSANSIQSPNNNTNPINTSNQARVKESVQQIKQQTIDLANDLLDLGDELAGKINDPSRSKENKKLSQQHPSTLSKSEESAATLAALRQQEEDDKKLKQKKKKIQEKLKTLNDIIDTIDTSSLTEEQKKEIELFKKNIRDLKTLEQKLKQLENEESHLTTLLNGANASDKRG